LGKQFKKFIEMDIDFEESDCEEMPDLNWAGSAHMLEPTKRTEDEKSVSVSTIALTLLVHVRQ
jgi:hypothetical protein